MTRSLASIRADAHPLASINENKYYSYFNLANVIIVATVYKQSILFDPTNKDRLLVGSPVGIRVLHTDSCEERHYPIVHREHIRPMCFDVWPETGQPSRLASIEAAAATANKPIGSPRSAILFTTAYKMNRFFVVEGHSDDPNVLNYPEDEERDVLNERPYHDALALASAAAAQTDSNQTKSNLSTVKASQATLHTTLGDISVLLYPEQCPKTVENFCSLAKSGYFNGHIFHRVIRQFMIQTGDPLGTGVGGQSIWGRDFEDEFHPSLKHDKPYTLSMANVGPNTNGSQFFITVVPCPWLDNNHTLFGRVIKGMNVVHKINALKTDKNEKPEEDVKIVSVTLK